MRRWTHSPLRHALSLSLAVLALSALFGDPASARQPRRKPTPSAAPDDATIAQAQQTVAEARTALTAGNAAGAYRLATVSYRLVPSPEALFLLARVARVEGRLLDAQDLMRRYLADPNLEAASDSPEQQEAQRLVEQEHPLSSQLTILGDRGTLVSIDGRLVGMLPLARPLLLSNQEHKVELERRERRLEDQVRVPVGRVGELRLDLTTRALLLRVLPGVLLLDDYRGLSGPERRRMELLVEQAVEGERLSLLPHELALELAGEPPPGPCADEGRCQMNLASKVEADYVLRARAERQGGGWQLAMDLFDVTVSGVAAHSDRDCPGCTAEQAAKELAGLFPPLFSKATGRARGRLEVRSDPPGATVFIDGEDVGPTPFAAVVWAGAHELIVRKRDLAPEQRQIRVGDGATTDLALTLQPPPEPSPKVTAPPPPPPPATVSRRGPRPLWRIVVGSIGLGAAALMLGFGASALYYDGQCSVPFPQGGVCRQFYQTQRIGINLTVAAALVGGASAGLIAWPGPRRQVTALSPNTEAGFGLVLSY